MPTALIAVFVVLFGLSFGSFANVVIWRFPRGESVSHPDSHCPSCGERIRWYDNVPLLSWVLLRARCRTCGEPISWRYPAIEGLVAVLWLGVFLVFGLSMRAAFAAAFMNLLVILAFIDLDLMRLPDRLVGILAALGAVGVGLSVASRALAVPLLGETVGAGGAAVSAGIGVLAGAGLPLAVSLVYERIRGREGFGGGDIKLLAAMGIFLGPWVLMALGFASLFGALAAPLMAGKRNGAHNPIPFGPFLALGAVVTIFVGPSLWGWYLGLLG